MAKLNLCETACCLVDPDDISKYEGYLPAFLTEEKSRILQFSKNIFTQSSDPSFDFIIDERTSDAPKYEQFKAEISKELIAQITDIQDKRFYQEIELQNALINFPSMLLGRKVCELEAQTKDKRSLVLCTLDLSEGFLHKIQLKREQFVLIAPLGVAESLKKFSTVPDFWVCSTSDKVLTGIQKEVLLIPVVADVTSLPGAVKDFDDVFWSSSPNFLSLDEEHVELVDFKSQWSRGRDTRLLALSVALHLGCSEVMVYSDGSKDFKEQAEKFLQSCDEEIEFSFLSASDDIDVEGKINFTLTLKDIDPDIKKALDFVGTVEEDIGQEREGEILHSVLRACDYDALVKMRNGFINYDLINYQEVDLDKKKSYFLSLIRELRKLLNQNDITEYEYRQQVSKKFSGQELFWDFDFEVRVLAHANPRLAMALAKCANKGFTGNDLRFSFTHKFKVDVEFKSEDNWKSYTAPCLEFLDEMTDEVNGRGILIVPGILDGQVQLQLLEMFEDIPIVTLVNRSEDLAELLKYVPLVSMLGRRGLWIHGNDNELAMAYKTLIASEHVQPLLVDLDPGSEFLHISHLKKLIEF
ncbi:MAG: hypothetical protein MK132_19620 [Lentisphaerales bacterium]|nr:hypothetical protein [Lentisphaerales bacterium]